MKYLIFFFSLFFAFVSSSQTKRCSFEEYREVLKQKGMFQYPKKALISTPNYSGTYTIPVVVHVLYNNPDQNLSDERIYSQMDVLNNDFNALNTNISDVPVEFQSVIGNVGISFCLIQEDLNGDSFSGINRIFTNVEEFQAFSDEMKKSDQGGVDAWDTENYLNIWVCDLSGSALGFATMPGDVSADLDGVVIDYEYFGINTVSSSPYNLGRTGTHELGHYLNLEHIFYAGCSSWDQCSDTPAQSSSTFGCPQSPQQSCQTTDMTMNYMDYTDDACMSMFTTCQANRMMNALINLRPQLSGDCSISTINESSDDLDLLIYPNPVIDELNINTYSVDVSIYNIYGKKVYSTYMDEHETIDVSFLSSGPYMLSIGDKWHAFIKQ